MHHPIGPARRPPPFYIGEMYKGRATMHSEVERYPNGAVASTRDKSARRMIRKAFGRSLSRIEQHLLKALDARNEIERLATNGHEAHRYWQKATALHTPIGPIITRSERRKLGKPDRIAEQELRVKMAEHRAKALEDSKTMRASLDKAIVHDGTIGIDPGYEPKKHDDIVIATVTYKGTTREPYVIIAKQS